MRFYYFFSSFFYFVKQVFTKKHYRIIFYSPHHFNRGINKENFFFKDLFNVCKQHDFNFLYLEEPDLYSNQNRSKKAIPFDFIYYLIIFLRKLFGSEITYIERDKRIGGFIKNIFFRKITFDNYITISQSMLSFFNGISADSKRFDLQHGSIHAGKKSYLYNGLVSSNLKENDVYLLLSGNEYKNTLVQNEKKKYFQDHIEVIGSSIFYDNDFAHTEPNKNVLVSLQFTHDHSRDENQEIADSLERKIKAESTFHYYLKNHPRFNQEVDLSRFLSLPNVTLIYGDLKDIFKRCSLHLTFYSTVTFEAGLLGIPTCFLKFSPSKPNFFTLQYKYPFYRYLLSDLYDNYSVCSKKSSEWANQFYEPFSAKSFLKSLKNA